MNRLYFGDNLDWLRTERIKDESVDLVYLDPPFNSKASYNVLYKSPVGGDAQVRAFEDSWRWDTAAAIALDDVRQRHIPAFNVLRALQTFLGRSDIMAYLVMMTVRLIELHRVLKPHGSIYLHCDPVASHYLKLVMDCIFGAKGFRDDIVWKRAETVKGNHGQGVRFFDRNTDNILFYAKGDKNTFNAAFKEYADQYIERSYRHVEPETQRRYQLISMTGPGGAAKGNPQYEVMGVTRYWRYSETKMQVLIDAGLVVQPSPGAVPRKKQYLDTGKGVPVQSLWDDIPALHSQSRERLGYPTQKPLALLKRVIATSSNEGDVILDPFCGCGTAIHAAEVLNRQWIGIDITYLAIQVIEDRFKTWLPLARYELLGIPSDELSARKLAELAPHSFQDWAVGRLGGQSRGRGSDKGIDGEIAFVKGPSDYGRAIVSVKGGQHVHPDMVRALKGVVQREGADMGVFVCLNPPTKDMRAEAATAGLIELPGGMRSRLQIVTAKDLIDGPSLGVLTQLNVVTAAQAARSMARRKPPRRRTPEELHREPPLPPMSLAGGKAMAAQAPLPLHDPLLVQPKSTKQSRSRSPGRA